MSIFNKAHPLLEKRILFKLLTGSLLDFSPPLVFIIAFELSDFYTATSWFMVATVLTSLFAIIVEKRIPYFSFYISFITLIFGASTLYFHHPQYIQIRDTVYDLVLAITLAWGYVHGKLFLKSAFSHSIKMPDSAWVSITRAWIVFLITIALSNEVARRVLTEGGWIYFKFIILVCTSLFGLWVLFHFYKPMPKTEEDGSFAKQDLKNL